MSSLQRTAHVTGLNNPFVDQYPAPGAYFAPQDGGAPGILRGPITGFSVAMGLHHPRNGSIEPWLQFDTVSGTPNQEAEPDTEFLVGAPNEDFNDGWIVAAEEDNLTFQVGDDGAMVQFGSQQSDLIFLASYVPDGTPYGIAAGPQLVAAINGLLEGPIGAPTAYNPVQKFSLGGSDVAALGSIAATGSAGGSLRTQINSFWITEGIPTSAQAAEFFAASMQAGQVIPQPWAVARTVASPNPTNPESPTGHHWTASDVDLSRGLGTTWVDTISGVVLELVGTLAGERELSRGHNYYVNGNLG